MSIPESLSARDIATLERAVKRYQSLGLEASLGINNHAQGRAAIWHVNPRWRGASTYQMEFEKYAGNFGGAVWFVQIARSNGATMTMRSLGKVSAQLLLFALTKAEKSIAESSQTRPDSKLHAAIRPVRAGFGGR